MRKIGKYERDNESGHFIPDSLPPTNPELILDKEILNLLAEASNELGKLNEKANNLPNKEYFIRAYATKEAILSSDMEGIHTTLLEVYTQPLLETKPTKNQQNIFNYLKAIDLTTQMIKSENLPISNRVILAAHKVLMEGENSSDPGNYRRVQVKVGNLIPAPASEVSKLMSSLERYINEDESFPAIIKAGLAHVQFEIIHPFKDGNGRIGRLLIVLILIQNNILSEPILYPSLFFKKNNLEYLTLLDRVRKTGDFESWIKFYLKVVRDSSIDAYKRIIDIEKLNDECLQILEKNKLGMSKALSIIFYSPIISIKQLSELLGSSYNTASKIISNFKKLGFLIEESEQKRNRLFRFQKYMDILEKDY